MSLFQVTKKQTIENYELRTMTGDIVSFTPSYSQLLPDPFSDLNVTVNVLATGGNGTPDNPNPINGYSEANVTRCGVNVWDENAEVGAINGTTGENQPSSTSMRSVGYIKVYPNAKVYIKMPAYGMWVYRYGADKSYISRLNYNANTEITIPADCYFIRFELYSQYGTTYNNDISINYPSTDTTYHACNGQTYTIAFGQTVYGGVLDVTRGKLTVKFLEIDLGTLTPVMYTVTEGNLFRYALDDLETLTSDYDVTKIICSNYPSVASASRANKTLSQVSNLLRFDIIDNDYNDAASMKTAMNGVQVVYPLATPIDIDLTPEVLSAIVGTNNVFAGCGNVTVTCLI